MKKDILFWDVDTQFDFMQPQGKLYVPGAERIIDRVSQVRRFALDNGFSIVASTDWHSEDNPEISDAPDRENTFPPHCMANEPGSERVGDLGELEIDYIANAELDAAELRKLSEKEQFHIVIRKEATDVFSNPNTAKLVELIAPKQIIVFGVALDICVDLTLRRLSDLEEIQTCLLKGAVKGLGKRPAGELFAEYGQMGIEITELNELKKELVGS
jgi:nicotinamidase/pyrazinamidase